MARVKPIKRFKGRRIAALDNGQGEVSLVKSCFLPFLLVVIICSALGVFVYRNWDKFFPKPEKPEEEWTPPKKEVVTNVVQEVVKEPEPPPPKTPMELKAEADQAWADLEKQISDARTAAGVTALPGFAGVRFGDVAKGEPMACDVLSGDGGVASNGYGLVVQGPVLKTPFRSFGNRPLVRVTPKTRQIYGIEFSCPLAQPQSAMPNAETTNLVAMLAKKVRRDPFFIDPEKFPFGRREYVFPLGETTLTVGEYGGDTLRLTVEHAGVKALVRGEAEELRKTSVAEDGNVKALGSDKYPKSGAVKTILIKVKKGTPKAFCGIAFGSLAPYGSKSIGTRTDRRGFFLDYARHKCRPFMNFEHGRAFVGKENGAVYGLELHSEGAYDGLTDGEFFEKVRRTLTRRYKTEPQEKPGERAFPKLVYAVGDLEITFGADPQGGFMLTAENATYKALW